MHCLTHNVEYSVQCSACGAEEEAKFRRTLLDLEHEIEALRQHLRLLELERDELYQRQNPGEYDCPYCLYRKLRTGVSRCPSCHAEITQEQWRPIVEIERALAKRWAREQPERQQKTQPPPKVTEAKRTKWTAKIYNDKEWNTWVAVYGGSMFPILTLLASAAIYWFWVR
jgi:ribosomal protein L37AE/L43A